jgi:hypothetical protein
VATRVRSETPGGIDRARVAAAFSPEALSRDRAIWSALSLLWIAATAFHVWRHGLGWSIWFPLLNLVLAAFRTAGAWRLHPRSPEEITDQQLSHATSLARSCRRCDGKVLTSEWRCPHCGSISHEFTFAARGIDVWMPVAILGVVLGFIILALAGR